VFTDRKQPRGSIIPVRFFWSNGMNRSSAVALAGLATLLTFLLTLVLELVIVGVIGIGIATIISGGDTSIGWDPVSLWHLSINGKFSLALIFGIPLILPSVASFIVYRIANRRLSSASTTQLT
jgi:hypothetical protein